MIKLVLPSILLLGSVSANAALISSQNSFADVSNWKLNGSTLHDSVNNRLQLTQTTSQGGSAFLTDSVSLNSNYSFSAYFQFEISNPSGASDNGSGGDGAQGADGLVFVVQTNSSNVGGVGGGIGYQGISNSVGIEFDTWYNVGNDNDGNHVGINTNGSVNSIVRMNESDLFNTGGIWSAWVDYNGSDDLLEVRWSDIDDRNSASVLSTSVDLAAVLNSTDAYFGFTSGTGAAGGLHEILGYEFRDDFSPVDAVETNAPGSVALLALGVMGMLRLRKRG